MVYKVYRMIITGNRIFFKILASGEPLGEAGLNYFYNIRKVASKKVNVVAYLNWIV